MSDQKTTTPFALGAYVGTPNNASASEQATFLTNLASFSSTMGAAPAFLDTYVNYNDPISHWASQNSWQASSWKATAALKTTVPVIGLPLNSTKDNADQDYKDFAAGKYDSMITTMVQTWANTGVKTQYWRLGWEMNLNGTPLFAGNMGTAQQKDWVAAFQHVSTVIHQAAQTFGVDASVIWNPGVTSYGNAGNAVTNLFPGAKFVDVIGADVYSDAYNFSLYDFTTGKMDSSFAQWAANPANLMHYYTAPAATQWSSDGSGGHATSLQDLINLAKSTGKPLAIVETGAGNSKDVGHDIPDNPYFVDWLSQTLKQAQQQGVKISFVNIWDSNSGGSYEFSKASDGKPKEAAAWAADFGAQPAVSATINSSVLTQDTGSSATDGITSNGAVKLSGSMTGPAGTIVQILDGTKTLGNATLAASGAWTFATTLSVGSHTLQAIAIDSSGHTGASSQAAPIIVETAKPVIAITSQIVNDTRTAMSNVAISGTLAGSSDASVQIFDGSVALGAATIGSGGTWTFTTSMSSGDHALRAIATDRAGNTATSAPVATIHLAPAPAVRTSSAFDPDSWTPPVLNAQTSNQVWRARRSVNFQLAANTFADPQHGSMTYSAYQIGGATATWLRFDATNGVFYAAPGRKPQGTITLAVIATDAAGLSAVESFNVTMAPNAAKFAQAISSLHSGHGAGAAPIAPPSVGTLHALYTPIA